MNGIGGFELLNDKLTNHFFIDSIDLVYFFVEVTGDAFNIEITDNYYAPINFLFKKNSLPTIMDHDFISMI